MSEEEYSVELWATAMPFPLNFAIHSWFVLKCGDAIDRYEVWATLGRFEKTTVFVNAIEPVEGFRSSFFDSVKNPKKKSVPYKLSTISGHEGSVAHEMYQFIAKTPETYPALRTYRLVPGPNSNTYVAWILSHYPESGLGLPWNAIGQGFKL